MNKLIDSLKAVAEPTRLRLMNLCSKTQLSASDLTKILGQSQPRISRHLKVLSSAGLLNNSQEGRWSFFRASHEEEALVLMNMIRQLSENDEILALDFQRLGLIKKKRQKNAEEYFRKNADQWNKIRSLHIDEKEVEEAIVKLFSGGSIDRLLDIGTGTGRMLELFGSRVSFGVGIDKSSEMLALARANLEKAKLKNCEVRQGDMYKLPWTKSLFDLILIHQVLHYAEDPEIVISEAARVLKDGGEMLVVDFASHNLENFRSDHAHFRLGFSNKEITTLFKHVGLVNIYTKSLPGDPLTVVLWKGQKKRK